MCLSDMYLYEIAHSRAGDKGDVSNISLIAYDERHYPLLVRYVTAERVRRHFDGIAAGAVERYEMPLIGALNFVMHDALAGGVTRSVNLDAHGKSLSSVLLAMDIPEIDAAALGADAAAVDGGSPSAGARQAI